MDLGPMNLGIVFRLLRVIAVENRQRTCASPGGPSFKAKFWAGGQRMWLFVFSVARAQATLSHRGVSEHQCIN
jgi:hypothetical protein